MNQSTTGNEGTNQIIESTSDDDDNNNDNGSTNLIESTNSGDDGNNNDDTDQIIESTNSGGNNNDDTNQIIVRYVPWLNILEEFISNPDMILFNLAYLDEEMNNDLVVNPINQINPINQTINPINRMLQILAIMMYNNEIQPEMLLQDVPTPLSEQHKILLERCRLSDMIKREKNRYNMCCVCQLNFEQDDALTILPCSGQHYFHDDCLDPWFNISKKCPVCRDDIELILNNKN